MTVRKSLLACGLMVLALAVAADAAVAGTLTITGPSYRAGNGGEFHISSTGATWEPPASAMKSGLPVNGEFNTFCVESGESLDGFGSKSYDVGTSIVSAGGTTALDERVAKLYYTFYANLWSTTTTSTSTTYDYDTAGDRGADGEALQQAVWAILNGAGDGSLSTRAKEFYAFADDSSLTWAMLGRSDWSEGTIGGVRVLNLYSGSGATRKELQSQLAVVPLPAGALMGLSLLAALGALSFIRKRRRLHAFS